MAVNTEALVEAILKARDVDIWQRVAEPANLLLLAGRTAQASALYTRLMQSPGNRDSLNTWIGYRLTRNTPDTPEFQATVAQKEVEVLPHFLMDAWSFNPANFSADNPTALHRQARAAARAGSFPEALALLERALHNSDIDRGWPIEVMHVLAASLAIRLGDREKAVEHLRLWYRSIPLGISLEIVMGLPNLASLIESGALRDEIPLTDAQLDTLYQATREAMEQRLTQGRQQPARPPWNNFLNDLARRLNSETFPPATEEELVQVEQRLGIHLPPSYREFLLHSNGFGHIPYGVGRLLPVEEIAWLRDTDPELVEIWGDEDSDVPDEQYLIYGDMQDGTAIRTRYFRTALLISGDGPGRDGDVFLVPDVITEAGEWETWFFASWIPGAHRYPSFREFLEERPRTEEN